MFGLMWPMARSRSAGIRFSTFSAIGVKRRMRRSALTITMAIWTLARRLIRSLLTRLSSSLRPCSSSLTVFSSSLVDCSSSFAVSSSSLVRLQLLVARQDLLVGRLQLLVGGFELLDDRLQVLAAGRQLALQQLRGAAAFAAARGAGIGSGRGEAALLRRLRRMAIEQHEEVRPAGAVERDHVERHRHPAVADAHLQAGLAHRAPGSCAPPAAPCAGRRAAPRAPSSGG